MTDNVLRVPAWFAFIVLMASTYAPSRIHSPYAVLVFAYLFLLWLFCIETALLKRYPASVTPVPKARFFAAILYAAAYLPVGAALLPHYKQYIWPFHVLGVFSMFYSVYFVSRTLVTIEEGKEVPFRFVIGTLLEYWLFPIGIWFVQPRMRKVYGSKLKEAA